MKLDEVMNEEDVMSSVAIDWVDDKLAQLSEEEQYSEMGDMLRYILKKLQS